MNKLNKRSKRFRQGKRKVRNPIAKALESDHLKPQVIHGKRRQYIPEVEDWELDADDMESGLTADFDDEGSSG